MVSTLYELHQFLDSFEHKVERTLLPLRQKRSHVQERARSVHCDVHVTPRHVDI